VSASAKPRFAAAAVLAGALAGALLPGARAGLGLVLVALALAAAAALGGGAPRPLRTAALGGLALTLAACAAFRDAGWVVAGELAAAVMLGSIAMSAPRHWRAIAHAAVAAVLRMPPGARIVGRAATAQLSTAPTAGALAVGRGLVLAGALLAIFGALFASGDRAFAQLAGDVLPDTVPPDDLPLRLVVFGLVTSLAGGLVQAATVADEPARRPLLRLGRAEWLLALGALNGLFALFVAVQLAVLFGGDSYVRETAGLTYAQYARSGFAQLVAVAALTLVVVASALRWARVERARDQAILRALLATLCLLTLVVLASALHRLGLYEEAYGFTRLRLAVHALLLFGGALFVLVVAALAGGRREWLAPATVVLGALAALAFWAGDPDRRIAAHNVERYEATGRIDTHYLSKLSADAVPALLRLPLPLREQALGRQRARLAGPPDGFAAANRARARARAALAADAP
jgi:uncharacterized protein DUF4153